MEDKTGQGEGITSLYRWAEGTGIWSSPYRRAEREAALLGKSWEKAPGCCHVFFIKNKG